MGKKDVFRVGDVVYLGGYPEHAKKPEFWAKVTGIIEHKPILYEIVFFSSTEEIIKLKLTADLMERVTGKKATLNDINTIFRLINPFPEEPEETETVEDNEDNLHVELDIDIDIDLSEDDRYQHEHNEDDRYFDR